MSNEDKRCVEPLIKPIPYLLCCSFTGSPQHWTCQESVRLPRLVAPLKQNRPKHRHCELLHIHIRQSLPLPYYHALHLWTAQPDIRRFWDQGHWIGTDSLLQHFTAVLHL